MHDAATVGLDTGSEAQRVAADRSAFPMPKLKFAVRALIKSPFVTLVAIVSLAFGIGANAAIFSLFDQILLRPLPVRDPDRLASLGAPGPKPGSQSCNMAGNCEQVFSYAMFRDLERVQTVFTGIAAHRAFGVNLAAKGQTLNGQGMLVSGNYFPLLGLTPALGRLIGPSDDQSPGQSPVAVLSYTFWRTRFDQSPSVLDEKIIINGQPMTIIGVAPPGFNGTTIGSMPQVFVPITMRGLMEPAFTVAFENRRSYWAYLFARLKDGVTIEQARTAINVPYRSILVDVEAPLQKGMSDKTMELFKARSITVEDGRRGQSSLHREAKTPLILLLGVTALVLLIACANIANLLLARAATRSGEMGVRLSIGASRWQLVAQLLFESCLLAACGGLAGLLVASWTLSFLASLLPAQAARMFAFTLEARVVAFAAAVTLATGLLFGLFPALHTTRPDLLSVLKGQAGQPSGARAAKRFRSVLATVQIALSMALLIAAGLFTRSLYNVSRVNLGVDTANLVMFGVSPMLNGYTPERSKALFERLEDELAAIPGVTSVSGGMVPLVGGSNWNSSVAVEGFDAGPDTDTTSAMNQVGPAYFRTVGIRLLAGREFTRADAAGAPKVAIVNEQFTKKFNLGRTAVGKRMSAGGPRTLDVEIVGVVQDAKYSEVRDPAPPQFFLPYRQDERLGFLTFYLRSSLGASQVLAAIPKIVAKLDPNLPVEELRTFDQQVRENVFMDRLISILSTAFACLATLLAAVGLYGVLAYTVAQRTREIGLRMALGASPERVRRMVLGQVAVMTLVGGIAGLAAAFGLGWYAQSLLYELKAHDPIAFAAGAAILVVVAMGAGLLPALRASRIDPMLALRYE
jgi:predicted permease